MTQDVLKVATTRFGTVEVPAERMLTFPHGMVGFPELHRYVLLHHREGSPFHWLQSVDHPDLAFVLANPLVFDPGYQVVLGNTESQLLQSSDAQNLQVWVVVTIPQGEPEKLTANLKAPVIINLENRLAAQVIMDDPRFPLRQPLRKQ
ncbi:MAG: flagellar assembly protein FliW [Desulfarculus sp.]|nr:flagellar assembly protein FliW [Desulfarculus sp.]